MLFLPVLSCLSFAFVGPPRAPGLPRCAFYMGAVTPLLVGRGFCHCVSGAGWRACGSWGAFWRLGLAPAPRFAALGSSRHGGVEGFAPVWVGAQFGGGFGSVAGRPAFWLAGAYGWRHEAVAHVGRGAPSRVGGGRRTEIVLLPVKCLFQGPPSFSGRRRGGVVCPGGSLGGLVGGVAGFLPWRIARGFGIVFCC